MKYTALTLWIAVGCIGLYGATQPQLSGNNVADTTREATLKNFTLKSGYYDDTQAPATNVAQSPAKAPEKPPVAPALNAGTATSAADAQSAQNVQGDATAVDDAPISQTNVAPETVCLIWGPLAQASLTDLNKTLVASHLDRAVNVIPFGNDEPVMLYTIAGTTQEKASEMAAKLRERGLPGIYTQNFEGEGYGVILGRYTTQAAAQHAARSIGQTTGLTKLNIVRDDAPEQRFAFLWRSATPDEAQALQALAKTHYEAALSPCQTY